MKAHDYTFGSLVNTLHESEALVTPYAEVLESQMCVSGASVVARPQGKQTKQCFGSGKAEYSAEARFDALMNIVAFGFLVEEDKPSERICNSFVQLFSTALDARRVLACSPSEVQVVICEGAVDVEISPLNLAAALHKDNPLRDIYIQKSHPNGLFISRMEAAGARGSISLPETLRILDLPLAHSRADEPLSEVLDTSDGHEQGAGECLADESVSVCESAEVSVLCDSYFIAEEEIPFNANIPKEFGVSERTKLVLPELKSSSPAPVDIAWLESILDLDDLDDVPLMTSTAGTAGAASIAGAAGAASAVVTAGAAGAAGAASAVVAAGAASTAGAGQLLAEQPELTFSTPSRHTTATQPEQEAHQQPEQRAQVAAFVSGRGGVGKSSLVVLTALELWLQGAHVALLDMDLQFGDISVLAGHEPQSTIERLSLQQLVEQQVPLPHSVESLLLIEPPLRPEYAEDLLSRVPEVIASLQSIVDIVLINTSCLWDETAAVLARSADTLVVCMDQRATSVSGARQLVDLCVRLQIPSTRLKFLLNRCSRTAPITDIDASLAMGGVEILTIAEGGSDVDELLSLGCPHELLSAQHALKQSIKDLGALLLPSASGHRQSKAGKGQRVK